MPYNIFTEFNDEDEDELKPSQVAARKQKAKFSIFSDLGSESLKIVEQRKVKKPEVIKPKEPEKPSFVQKAVKGVKEFLFGKKKEELVTPEGFTDEQYVSLVSTVQGNKVNTQRELEQAEKELSTLQKRLGIHQVGKDPEEERLLLKTRALKETVQHYDNFITREPARRGVLQEILQGIKDPVKTLGIDKFWETRVKDQEVQVMQKYERGEELTKDEMVFYNKVRARTLDSYIQKGLGSSVGEVIVNMPAYMMEIAVMSQTAGPEGAYKNIAQGISNLTKITVPVAQTIVSKVLTNSVRKAVASQIAFTSVDSKTADYMLPTYEIQQDVEGKDYLKLVKPGSDKNAAVSKAYASNLVEYVSEGVGDYVDDALPFVKKLFISKWLQNNGVDEVGEVTSLLRKLNFNSLVGEVLEEEIGEPFQAMIDEREYKDPFFTPEGRERLLVETLGVGAFSGMAKVSDYTVKAIRERKSNFPNDTLSLNVVEGKEAEALEAEERKRAEPKPEAVEVEPPPEPKKPVEKVIEKKVKPIEIEPVPKELELLAKEAKKYKSVEEFRDALFPSGGIMDISNRNTQRFGRAMSSSIAGEELPNVRQFAKQYDWEWKDLFRQVGQQPPDIKSGKITVWRAAPEGTKIETGDWVALTKDYAEGHLGKLGRSKLYKSEVPVEDVVWAGTDQSEWLYVPDKIRKTFGELYDKKNLEDFYKASVVQQPIVKDRLGDVKKYKTTVNIQNKDDLEYLGRILSEDNIKDIKSGKMTNWRGNSYEDLARVNIIDEPYTKPKLKIEPYKGTKSFYHGTSPESADLIAKEGFKAGSDLPEDAFRSGGYGQLQGSISLSSDAKIASNFTGTGSQGALVKTEINPKAKIVSVKGIDYAEDLNDYIPQLKKDGIDAVWIGGGEKELVVINPEVIQAGDVRKFTVFNKDKELADFYKPSVAQQPLGDLAQEAKKYKSAEEFVEAVDAQVLKVGFGEEGTGIAKVAGNIKIRTKSKSDYVNKLTDIWNKATQQPLGDIEMPKTIEEFKGEPRLYTATKAQMLEGPKKVWERTKKAPKQPFLSDYQIRKGSNQYVVYDGDKVIATFSAGDNLTVNKDYRRRGIAEELVYQYKTEVDPLPRSTSRSKAVDKLYEKVWERIKRKTSRAAQQPVSEVKKKITPKKPTKKAIEQRETRTAEREIAKAERSFYSASELKNITRIKRISRSKAFVEGDIETLRKKYPKLVEDVVEASRRRYGEGISDSEALDLALRVPNADLSAPAGYATTGIYSTIESAEKIVDDKKPIEFPELVKLVKELTDDVPTLKSFKKKLGAMYARGKGEIKLAPEIFNDPVTATKVLSHEIGHLADYLPEGNIKRGNIVGRIATLGRNMKQLYRNLSDKKIRKQLKDLTQLWRPFDENKNPTFTKYRYSAPELYADAVSVLLNDPALLQQIAPDFYDGFFEYLGRKPEVETNYFKLLDLLGRGEETVNEDRLNRIYEGYKEAKQKRLKIAETLKPAPSWRDNFVRQHITKFGSIYKKYGKTDQGNGIRDSAKQRVREALEEMQYKANQTYLFLDEVNSDMLIPLKEIGVSEEEFGAIIQLERQVLGDRKLLANPEGLIGDTSERVLKHLRTKFTEDQVKVIKQVKDRFHQKIFSYVKEAVDLGIYNKETFDTVIEPNKNTYATFSVVKYINKNYIPSSIKKQVGTVREIENPLNSTILKTVSLINFIEVQKGKLAVVQDYKNVFSDEYEEAKAVRGLGGRFIKFKPKENYEVLDYLKDGKKVGIYVDPYVKKMFDSDFLSPSELHTAVRVSGAFNRVFKPIVTSYKLSWALYSNIIKDSKRTYKNLSAAMPKFVKGKKITLAEYVTTWVKAIPGAHEFAKGKLTTLTKEMLADKAFTVPFTQFDPIANQESVLAPILRRYNLLPRTNVKLEGVKKVFDKTIGKVLRAIETAGATFEATSKIAGYQITKRRIKDGNKLGFITRNYVGTPNFVEGGSKKQIDNNLFVFSNVMIQALRTDIELATNPKTRSGYWWKTMQVDIIPKMIMLAAAGGLLGDELKKLFDRMTEYDKTNYITVPIGMDGDKVVYLRIPQDETGRLFSAMVWKLGRAMQGGLVKPEQVADLTAGFLPSATPLWGIAGGWLNFLKGRNPYDDYRGRLIIDDYTWKAGGWPKISKMVQWTLNEAGLSAFKTYDDASKSTTEAIIEKIPVLKFMIKTSDYGLKERLSVIEGKIKKDRAKVILKKNEIINDYVKKAKATDSKSEMKKLEKEMIEKIHGKKPEDKAEVNRDIKKLRIQTQKGENPYVDALIYANTNDEKVALLRQYQGELSTSEYNEVVDVVKEFKIVSDNVFKELKKKSAIKPERKIGLNIVKPAQAAEKDLAFTGTPRQERIYRELKDWTTGEASYYNPKDPAQTRKGTTGVGAYGRQVEPGSAAFGNRVFHDTLKKGEKIYIEVKGFEDVKTPYGDGIFRIDDTMNLRYSKKGQFNIDFHPADLTPEQKKKGRYGIEFRIVEPKPKKKKTKRYYA